MTYFNSLKIMSLNCDTKREEEKKKKVKNTIRNIVESCAKHHKTNKQTKLQEVELDPISRLDAATFVCLSKENTWISNVIYCGLCVLNCER
jgi:hypothetical protein